VQQVIICFPLLVVVVALAQERRRPRETRVTLKTPALGMDCPKPLSSSTFSRRRSRG
jgi:hypothetical protein